MRPEYNKDYFAKRNQLFSFLKAGLFAFLIKIFLKPRTLLDVGCAGGELVKITSMLGIKTFGIDISKSAINCANKDSGGVLPGPAYSQFRLRMTVLMWLFLWR
jgi:2-polyprenyl-3-methyl-5-hydroxy-6-metoxy-1,4-benzoquinol methylase